MGRNTKITGIIFLLGILSGLTSNAQGPTTLTVDCPKNITLTEGQSYDTTKTGAPKIILNNGGQLRLTLLEVFQKGNCSNQTDVVTRNFIYTNAIGDQARCSQDIFFRHIKASSIYTPKDTAIEYPDSNSTLTSKLLGLPAELGSVNLTYIDMRVSQNCNTPVKIRRTWKIEDKCTGQIRNAVSNIDVYFYQLSFKQFVQKTDGVCIDEGIINLSPAGEFKPYTYLWNNGEKTATISNLVSGTYTVTVTDANQCSQIRNYQLESMSERADIAGRLATGNSIRVVPDSINFIDPSLYSKICVSPTSGIHYAFNLKRKTPGTFLYSFVKNTEVLEGLSTKDILMIQRHILGTAKFKDTLQNIAADVNINFNITASDMAEIRSIILGKNLTFSKAKPWYFLVPDWRQLAKPNQPISNIEFKGITIQNFPRQNINAFALKMGDIDQSYINAKGNHTESRANRETGLNLFIENNNKNRFAMYAETQYSLSGIQFALSNNNATKLHVVNSQIPEEFYHVDKNGLIRICWNDANGLNWDNKKPLFEIVSDDFSSNEMITLHEIVGAECYDLDLQSFNVNLLDKSSGQESVFSIHPNPSNGDLTFSEPVSQIEFFDMQGRKVFEWNGYKNSSDANTNIYLPKTLRTGQYQYRLITAKGNIHSGKISLQ